MEKGLEPLEVLPPTSQQKLLSYSFWVWYKFLLLESFNLIIQSTKEDWKLLAKPLSDQKLKFPIEVVQQWKIFVKNHLLSCSRSQFLRTLNCLLAITYCRFDHSENISFFYCYVCKWSPGDRVCYRMTQWVLIYPKRSEKLDLRQKALWYSLAVIVSKICYLF